MKVKSLLIGAFEKESRAITFALALLLLALFLPSFEQTRDTVDYIVFFDITQSMNVEDYKLDGAPVSRLAYAREAFRSALRDLPCGSHIGLGAFAEHRTLLLLAPVEVCGNYNDLLASLDHIDGRMRWHNSSEISKGVFWSVRAAKELGQNTNVIFLTDGQEAPPLRSSEQPMFEEVMPGEIRGWLIGVGGYTPQPIPKTDREGRPSGYWRANEVIQRDDDLSKGTISNEHLSGLREPHLQAIAGRVGFEYAHLIESASLSAAMFDPRFARRRLVPTDFSWLPAAMALLALALRFGPDIRQTVQKH